MRFTWRVRLTLEGGTFLYGYLKERDLHGTGERDFALISSDPAVVRPLAFPAIHWHDARGEWQFVVGSADVSEAVGLAMKEFGRDAQRAELLAHTRKMLVEVDSL